MLKIRHFILASALILGLFSARSVWLRGRYFAYVQDDLQHAHIAWNVCQGKRIYRDFYEHHGPINAWVNANLLRLKHGVVESTQTLTEFRFFQTLATWFTALFVGLIVARVSPLAFRLPLGVLASAVYLSLQITQLYSFYIRPDGYVGLFVSLAFLLWCYGKKKWAGASFGIALGYHPKFFPLNLAFLVSDQLAQGFTRKKKRDYSLLMGEAVVVAGVVLILGWQGSLEKAIDFLILANSKIISKRIFEERIHLWELFENFWKYDPLLLGLFVLGLAVSLRDYFKKDKQGSEIDHSWLFCALSAAFFLISPVHEYALLMILPLVVIFSFVAMIRLSVLQSFTVTSACFLVFVCILVFNSQYETARIISDTKLLRVEQDRDLSFALTHLKRKDPVFYVWRSRCAAYVFNEDSQYFWMRSPRVSDEERNILPGEPVSPSDFKVSPHNKRNRLKEEGISWVAITDEFVSELNDEEQDYLSTEYEPHGCLWSRR